MRKFPEVSSVKSAHLKIRPMNLSFIKRVIPLFLLCLIFGCSAAKVTNVNHNEFPANCISEKETRIQDSKEFLDCIPPSKDAKVNTIALLENSTEDIKTKETDGEQRIPRKTLKLKKRMESKIF